MSDKPLLQEFFTETPAPHKVGSNVLDLVVSHKEVLFRHVRTGAAFLLDSKNMSVRTENKKTLVCQKVSVDTMRDDKVWFKGKHIGGEEFYLCVTMKKGKLLFRGNKANCEIKYIC
ncbi:hypothetical protein C8_352 [Cannes 8 virus]|uniref:hypothetical protein n=1 Tax=Melbournevirus TaxID=1560514 RepID=UPI000392B6CA|nr:hypothetical protein MEL_298 [Melbournevirus]AGV01701.1 hypothetical protein C8_352 [Cannes 8 virus]AIT54911.1 hypothetical protein MEL_298 [Melbournevirus]